MCLENLEEMDEHRKFLVETIVKLYVVPTCRECCSNSCPSLYNNPHLGHGWRGAVQILSTMPTVDWVLLGSGKSNKGQELGSLYCSLSAGRTLPLLAGITCNNKNDNKTGIDALQANTV